ncbi:GINS complex subunit Sld5 [Macrophomina phaseolina MS6]|uniref:DNA replication complex GINS protein SLD5 n=1 Tax=Macrophomina phaseolina (strain MS6) TaxID=1126212 RepID=K2S8M4_MACPH|nr:GINS complex subunit Sld5 [Macrophomina phaseolina MS6]
MDPKTNFRLILYQTELERFKFLVRSFLRARIAKVRFRFSFLFAVVCLSCTVAHFLCLETLLPWSREGSCREMLDECMFEADLDSFQIDKHPLHILTTPETLAYLSRPERQYLEQHQALLSQHYAASFLSSFPPQLQRLDDKAGGISMIDTPDLDTAVFCRVLRDIGVVSVGGVDEDREVEMKRGDVLVVRWRVVRERVLAGDIELI